MIQLKSYIRNEPVKAIRITKTNLQELLDMDGDGCIESAGNEIGDWFVVESCGNQTYDNEMFHELFKKTK